MAKGNPGRGNRGRTQRREALQQPLARIRQAARKDRGLRFTALWHHVYDVDRLREAYFDLKRDSAPGVDGMTWSHYGEDLETHLADLSGRLKRGAYRAKPVRRVLIPKADGRQRPIGVPTLEDKIVQRAAAEVIGTVFEADFKGFSYGFRPGRSQHNALDAVTVGLKRRKVNWVLDMDIRGFFDTIDHGWIRRFVEHRVADRRVLRHVQKWLNAGVMENGERVEVQEGTPQGGSISPLLANIYLHYVFDLWVDEWRKKRAGGDVVVVRYADDILAGFQHRAEAERFLREVAGRLRRFGLELNPTKTRLIEFGRYAAGNRKRRGAGKPETFDFLGFTHICSKTRNGAYQTRRKTMPKRLRAKLKDVKAELRRRMHSPTPATGRWLQAVVRGYFRYHGVPGNHKALWAFREQVTLYWRHNVRRQSQKTRLNWERMGRLARRWLPYPRIVHPYPEQRLCVTT